MVCIFDVFSAFRLIQKGRHDRKRVKEYWLLFSPGYFSRLIVLRQTVEIIVEFFHPLFMRLTAFLANAFKILERRLKKTWLHFLWILIESNKLNLVTFTFCIYAYSNDNLLIPLFSLEMRFQSLFCFDSTFQHLLDFCSFSLQNQNQRPHSITLVPRVP